MPVTWHWALARLRFCLRLTFLLTSGSPDPLLPCATLRELLDSQQVQRRWPWLESVTTDAVMAGVDRIIEDWKQGDHSCSLKMAYTLAEQGFWFSECLAGEVPC